MGLWTGSILVDLALAAVTLFIAAYYYFNSHYGYWKARGVKCMPTQPFFGSIKDIMLGRITFPQHNLNMYKAAEGEGYVGMISPTAPNLVIRDPELVKDVLARDFSHFHDRGVPHNEKTQPLSAHLFALDGARWRNLRIKLTPTFTSGKMKRMYPLMRTCAEELVDTLRGSCQKGENVEYRDLMARFTTDVIGSCAFGVDCNSLKDPNTEFRRIGMKIFQTNFWSRIRLALQMLAPKLSLLVPGREEATKFFLNIVKQTVEHREKSNVKRNDFMDLLIEIKKKGKIVDDVDEIKNDVFVGSADKSSSEHMEFTNNLMAAQAFVFFVAGFETSSTTLSFALLELACNPSIQERARKEVDEVLAKSGDITYEAVTNMQYIDQVISETLRKYPPVAGLIRKCTEPYQLPGTKLTIEKGTRINIPVYGMHHDPELYPDPETFDPDRFSPEAKESRHPYTYLPFGEGPRICIGMRFGLLQTKTGLAFLLSNFEFKRCAETRMPVEFKKRAVLLTPVGGVRIQAVPRRKD